jgi:hypothetical protein
MVGQRVAPAGGNGPPLIAQRGSGRRSPLVLVQYGSANGVDVGDADLRRSD